MSSTRSVPAPPAPPNTRAERALRLYEEHRREIVLVGPDTFEVPSCTGRGVYLVEYGGENENCSCPDAAYHPGPCKHLLAVALCFAKRRQLRYGRGRAAPGRDLSEHKVSRARGWPPSPAPVHSNKEVIVDTTKFNAPRATNHDVDERIREDAAAHPERSYREHVEAAQDIAAESYRAELRKLAVLDMLEATETIEMYASIEDGPHICAYHVADDPLYDEIDEYAIALEKLEAYLKGARRNDNRMLVRDLERLETDYRARLDWLQDLAERFKSANKNVTVYTGE